MIRYAGVEHKFVTEGDAADLHEYFRNIFGSYGIHGQALDYAIADCVRAAFASIEAHRACAARITLVKPEDSR